MANELLPIGSVVQLSDSTALVLVAGYLAVNQSTPGYVWDYSGFKFPIGYTDDEEIYCFDHSQIETVYVRGYHDIEEDIFMSRLTAARTQLEESGRASESSAGGQGGT